MIIDHAGFSISDPERSKAFYTQALAPLNISIVMEMQGWMGFGANEKPEFWIGPAEKPHPPTHIAFAAETREQVDAFYAAALAAAGKDNGKPGIREDYHPNYYAAYVIDPDGHNIEAVCHA